MEDDIVEKEPVLLPESSSDDDEPAPAPKRKAAAARATASSPTKYSTAAAECVRADSFSSDSSSLDT